MTPATFAPAAGPVSAQAIHTSAEGLEAATVTIPVGGAELPAYMAVPARDGRFPLILVIQEIFGVHEYIQDVCRRLAQLGYMAVAPELFFRQGDTSKLPSVEAIRPVVARVPDTQVMADLDATVEWAEKAGKADTGRLGITGFCWGGRITWLYAAHSPRLKAGVAWYGRLADPADPLHPNNPVELAAGLRCPVLGLYGGQDAGIPLADVERMRAAIVAAGKPAEIVVYPEAGHAFHADYRPNYDAGAAVDGWRRMLEWFRAHGLGSGR